MAASIFCKGFVDISYENASFLMLEDYVAAAYLFLNYNFIFSLWNVFLWLMEHFN